MNKLIHSKKKLVGKYCEIKAAREVRNKSKDIKCDNYKVELLAKLYIIVLAYFTLFVVNFIFDHITNSKKAFPIILQKHLNFIFK